VQKLIENKNLLIVDDEVDFAKVLSWDFQDMGLNVQIAEGAHAAVELLKITNFDFILSDVEMPKGNGVELITYTKNQSVNLIGFFFMTGFTQHTEEELKSLGMQKLYKKPINTEVVFKDFLELIKK